MSAAVTELHDLDVAAEPPPGVNLVGFLDAEFGLGEAARMLGRALEHVGVPIAAITNTETPVRREHELGWPLSRSVPYDTNVLCLQPDQVAGFAAQVGPRFFENRSTIALWFWDSSVLHARYDEAFRFLDRVWVMTEHVREVVSAATDMPVHLVPIPAEERTPSGISREELGLPEEFLFMALFDFVSFERKNPSRQPAAFERYAASKLAEGRSPKSVRNDLVLLGLMFKTARRWRWVGENPLELVGPPSLGDTETETLAASDVAAVLKAYRELEARAEGEDGYWYAAARRMTTVALATGLRRGELLGLRWQDVELLDRRLHVRQAFVRNEITTPKSKAGRRTIDLGDVAIGALEEQFTISMHRAPESIVFCHPALGSPLDPSKLTKYARKALERAGVDESFRPWHGLRHTALTETAAAGVPGMFVQAKAGHAQGSTTERYLHASRTSYPDAAQLAEARLFGARIAGSASEV